MLDASKTGKHFPDFDHEREVPVLTVFETHTHYTHYPLAQVDVLNNDILFADIDLSESILNDG